MMWTFIKIITAPIWIPIAFFCSMVFASVAFAMMFGVLFLILGIISFLH